jgi:hypothetical protein
VPLRSVEAATRDDAIAAAREQFGPSARVVGVRRVRSGGVLGFFATERYVAEVAPDPGARPPVPSGRASTSSPLASAAPATARPTAPARNGAAAYAAAATSFSESPAELRRSPDRDEAPARPAPVVRAPAEPAPRTAQTADEARLSELVGLLAAEAQPAEPAYGRLSFPRAAVVRSARESLQAVHDEDDDEDDDLVDDVAEYDEDDAPVAPVAPSPFTAALARMVSGDRDVRQAVEEALEQPAAASPAPSPALSPAPSPTPVGPWPTWSGPVRAAEPSVPSPPARQEEETVGDQVIAPPSMPEVQPAEVPAWAAAPEVATGADSSREEAIAEVLRSALAQGHSDEALAGILRKVLAGASPQTALTEPDLALPNLVADVAVDDDAAEHAREAAMDTAVDIPVVTLAAAELPAVELPVVELLPVEPPAMELPAVEPPPVEPPPVVTPAVVLPAAELPAVPAPLVQRPAPREPDWAPAVSDTRVELFGPDPVAPSWTAPTWHDIASQSPLWADVAPRRVQADAPIWAEVTRRAPEADAGRTSWSLFGTPAEESAPLAPQAEDEIVVPEVVVPEVVVPEVVVPEVVVPEVVVPEAVVHEAVEDVAIDALEDVLEDVVPEPAVDVVPEPAEAVLPEPASEPAADEATAPDSVASETLAEDAPAEETVATPDERPLLELGPLLARTASDPAPLSLDATTVMPPLSLLPPLPGTRGRGRPPVPPARLPRARPSVPPAAASAPPPAPTAPADETREFVAPAPSESALATVTRLPVVPLVAPPEPSGSAEPTDATETAAESSAESLGESPATESVEEPAEPSVEAAVEPIEAVEPAEPVEPTVEPIEAVEPVEPVEPRSEATTGPGHVLARLAMLGLPAGLLGDGFAEQVAVHGTYAALTRALGLRLPPAPEVPTGPGEVLFVVGPGIETLRAARALAVTLRLDPEKVQWATRGDLVGLAPEGSRVATTDAAIDRRQAAANAGTVTIVAVDAPLRTDAYWMAQMLTIWSPVAVWAVVEATRKPEDLEPWLAALSRVDALIVQDTDLSADPAAVLRRVAAPVALLDGVRATPHRWASLLCERLEGTHS